MSKIFRNKVNIINVHNKRGKQFAFGVLLEPEARNVFIPHWVVKAFEITTDDQGYEFDCLFVDQNPEKSPMVIAIIDEDILKKSEVVGEYSGRPNTPDFTAIVNKINRG
jgi:hypothetical protein